MKFRIALLCLVVSLCWIWSCDTNPYKQGKVLYEKNCQNCHQEDGKAVATLIPPLAGSDYLTRTNDIVCNIHNGMKGEIMVNGVLYNHEMPAIPTLSAIQIANIINYIKNSWGNEGEYVSYEEVKTALDACGGE